MLKILEFMFSGPFKFLGCFFILLLILALIDNIITNVCNTIIACKSSKDYSKDNKEYNEDLDIL